MHYSNLPNQPGTSGDAPAKTGASNASNPTPAIPRVLSIAGTDPSGGAGQTADLKSIAAAGGFGMSVITALVSQNTQGVQAIEEIDHGFVRKQFDSVFGDVAVDAIKIGMLGDAATVALVREALRDNPAPVVVLDPVMVSSSGHRLLEEDAEDAVRGLVADVDVITPNVPELAVLTGKDAATDYDAAVAQAQPLARENDTIVIIKGGHLSGERADNAVVYPDGRVDRVSTYRINTRNTHGTGCSLSSAQATRMGLGDDAGAALRWSTRWLHEAIENGEKLQVGGGTGFGPVDHSHRCRRLEKAASSEVWPHLRGELPEGQSYAAAPTPHLEPAGPHTRRLWELTGQVWQEIMELPFIRGLASGRLPEEDFNFYLAQDALYLNRYSRALAELSTKAPDSAGQVMWAGAAAGCIEGEAELHRTWLAGRGMEDASANPVAPSPVTLAYTNFLVATAVVEPYVCGVAGVLPCFWLYAEIGLELTRANHDAHPFKAWLDTYADEEFLSGAREAIQRTEAAFEAASEAEREAATSAYLNAAVYEREFFDQADRRW